MYIVNSEGTAEKSQLINTNAPNGYSATEVTGDSASTITGDGADLDIAVVGTGSGAFVAAIKAAERTWRTSYHY